MQRNGSIVFRHLSPAAFCKRLVLTVDSTVNSHYRDKDKNEVDIVIEDESGGVVGLEIKASATVRPADFAGLRKLAAAAGKNFRLGAVLHDGDAVIGFGGHLYAAPLSCLWRSGPKRS